MILSATTLLWDLPKGEATLEYRRCSCRLSSLPSQCKSVRQTTIRTEMISKLMKTPVVGMLGIVTAFVSICST